VVAVDAGCYANSIEGKGEDYSVPRLRCGARPLIAPSKETSETRKYGQYGRVNNLTNGAGYPPLNIPPFAPVPAKVSFDIEWSGITDREKVVNVMQSFRGQFVKTGATIDWSAESDDGSFAFQSESPNPARDLYAVIGHEQNGVFFHLEGDDV